MVRSVSGCFHCHKQQQGKKSKGFEVPKEIASDSDNEAQDVLSGINEVKARLRVIVWIQLLLATRHSETTDSSGRPPYKCSGFNMPRARAKDV